MATLKECKNSIQPDGNVVKLWGKTEQQISIHCNTLYIFIVCK